MLTVEHLGVSFPGRTVLQDVSFQLDRGEICGLIGANGSGKTTLLRTVLGFQRATTGTISIQGAQARAGLACVGYVPQHSVFDPDMPLRARDLVALGLDGHRLGPPLPSRKRSHLVEEMLTAVDASGFADQRIGMLSGGQRQRILIAHALIRRPRLLLLDEPLANLDLRSVSEIVALLGRLAAEQRMTVLLSTHDINPLLTITDRIVYLANGKAASGVAGEVVRSEVLSRLYGYHIDVIRVHGRVLVVAAASPEDMPEVIANDPVHVTPVP